MHRTLHFPNRIGRISTVEREFGHKGAGRVAASYSHERVYQREVVRLRPTADIDVALRIAADALRTIAARAAEESREG